ncbi:MAG: hypothetical protein JW860_00645 [Sedimentisphaerales bacterium]|nr:hypothetical protein [Sedimentisphaerales bacterium]
MFSPCFRHGLRERGLLAGNNIIKDVCYGRERKRSRSTFKLSELQYTRFNDRRACVWKLNFAVWAALAVFLAIIIKGEISLKLEPYHKIILIFAAIIITIQFLFRFRSELSLRVETEKSLYYEKKAAHFCGVDYDNKDDLEGKKVRKSIKNLGPDKLWKKLWVIILQVSITVLLILVIVLTLCSPPKEIKDTNKNNNQCQQAKECTVNRGNKPHKLSTPKATPDQPNPESSSA